jgi:hypothetical protein
VANAARSEDILAARNAGSKLYEEFSAEVKKHVARGLADVKMQVMAGHDTPPGGVMRTVSKVLRAVYENKTEPLKF